MRIFYAVQFPDIIKQAMAENLTEIKKHALRGNFTRRENFHLTLLFVGECEPRSLANFKTAADSAIAKLKPAPVKAVIDGLGTFPRPDGDILWASMQTEPENILGEVNNALLAELRALNINIRREHNRFVPHVTIGRKTELRDKNLNDIKFAPVSFEINSIAIMESVFTNGVTYEPLHESKFL